MKCIGITCKTINHKTDEITSIGVQHTYIDFVRAAGALPILLPMNATQAELDQLTPLLSGVIFTGGADIHPKVYNQPQKRGLEAVDSLRDVSDLALMRWAFDLKLPLFCICRGMQLLNVYCGGTLQQDIDFVTTDMTHRQMSPCGTEAHAVEADPNSTLYSIFGKQTHFAVNSHHHQVIDQLGKRLKAVLRSPDGVIEGIELMDADHLALGVQFHPEMFMLNEEYDYMRAAFKHFVELI